MKIGDRVAALDEDIEGVVIKIDGDDITIETDDFEMQFKKRELILIEGQNLERNLFANKSTASVIAEKESTDRPFLKPKSSKKNQRPPMEVDLHAHQLRGSTKGMSKHQVLNLQIDAAKSQLEFAIRKNIQKIVYIHGVGEGVLKMELETLFRRYEVKFYDADFKKYGFGATEVYIFQNTPSED